MQGWAVDALPTPMCHETDIHVACRSLLTNLFTCQLFWVSETPHIKCQALNTGPSPEVCSERNGSKMDRGGKNKAYVDPNWNFSCLFSFWWLKQNGNNWPHSTVAPWQVAFRRRWPWWATALLLFDWKVLSGSAPDVWRERSLSHSTKRPISELWNEHFTRA